MGKANPAVLGFLVGSTILALLSLAAYETGLGLGPELAISVLAAVSAGLVWWTLTPTR